MGAVNRGSTRSPVNRDIVLQIALTAISNKFELRARYIPGPANTADGLSRGLERPTTSNWTFVRFNEFNSPPATIDACAEEDGSNCQPGCSVWFSATRPIQDNWAQIIGNVVWRNPPFHELSSIIPALLKAWSLAPHSTTIRLVVPEWPTAGWFRKYYRRRRPVFRLLKRFPAGARLFRSPGGPSAPTPPRWPVLLVQIS